MNDLNKLISLMCAYLLSTRRSDAVQLLAICLDANENTVYGWLSGRSIPMGTQLYLAYTLKEVEKL